MRKFSPLMSKTILPRMNSFSLDGKDARGEAELRVRSARQVYVSGQ